MPAAPVHRYRSSRLSWVFGLLAALLVLLEAMSFAALRLLTWWDQTKPIPHSPSMSAYQNQVWANTFWREQRYVLSYEAYPNGLWRSRPINGETIVVDTMGIRRTAHTRCDGNSRMVYVFGGSSVWGYGSPDWETIPSHLARRFAQDGKPACVVNMGSDSWRIDQGVIRLIQELKRPGRGRRPDLVIFINGCNDVFTPFFLTGRVDWEWEFQQTKEWLNELVRLREASFRYVKMTNTWKLGLRVVVRVKGSKVWTTPENPDRLAREIADAYAANIRIVDGLSRSHGFQYAFFWQPMSIAGHKALTTEEEEGTKLQLAHWAEAGRGAVAKTLPLLHAAAAGQFHDLTGIFDARTDSIYIDSCHLVPAGNRLLADRIYSIVK